MVGAVAAVAVLAGVQSSPSVVDRASAEEICYGPPTPTVEYIYVRDTVTTAYRWDIETRDPILKYRYQKEIRGNIQTRIDGSWVNTGTFDWEPWPLSQFQPDGYTETGMITYTFDQTGTSNGSTRKVSTHYRYTQVVPSETQVDGYTPWVPAGSTPWGPSSTPPADTATTRYVNPQTDNAVPGPPEFSAWLPEGVLPEGEGWELYDERAGADLPGEEIPCEVTTTTAGDTTTTAGDTTTTAGDTTTTAGDTTTTAGDTTTTAGDTTTTAGDTTTSVESEGPTTTGDPTTTSSTLVGSGGPTTTAAGSLPRTGGSPSGTAGIALAMLLVGFGAVGAAAITRRRPAS